MITIEKQHQIEERYKARKIIIESYITKASQAEGKIFQENKEKLQKEKELKEKNKKKKVCKYKNYIIYKKLAKEDPNIEEALKDEYVFGVDIHVGTGRSVIVDTNGIVRVTGKAINNTQYQKQKLEKQIKLEKAQKNLVK